MSKKPLKLPILKMGTYKHPKHGDLKIDQTVINDVMSSFESKAPGYEPYLRYGHNQKGPGLVGGEPAQGRLQKLVQENDVLFGFFNPTNENVVDEVRSETYKYGSAELIFNAKHKTTGERIPAYLKGHSLTNEPFIPGLPANQVLEDDAVLLSDEQTEVATVSVMLADIEYVPAACTNCVEDLTADELRRTGWCDGICDACLELAAPRKNEEKGVLRKILKGLSSLASDISSLKWRVDDLAYAKPATAMFADPEPETPAADADPEVTPPAVTTPPDGEPTPEPVAPPESQGTEPPALSTETTMTPEEIAKLQADLAAALADKEASDAAKAAAEAAAQEAQAALAAHAAAEQAAAEKAAADAAEAEKAQFAAMLTDRCEKLVGKGAVPAKVEQARQIVEALRANETTAVCLSEGAEPIDLSDAIFALLTEGAIDFGTHGETPVETGNSKNPFAGEIEAIRARRAGKN